MPRHSHPLNRPQGPRPQHPQELPVRNHPSSRPLPHAPPIPRPVEPSEGSGRGFPRSLATEDQHLLLRLVTWFLSKTNGQQGVDATRRDLNFPTSTANRMVLSSADRMQRELYDYMEALCHLLERNHESIAALPADTNAFRILVSRTHSAPAPATLHHVVFDLEEVLMFGHTLELDEELYMPFFPRTEEEAAQQAAEGATSTKEAPGDPEGPSDFTEALPADPVWGHDLKAFVSEVFETYDDYDAPYPPRDESKFASEHGYWLMQHTVKKIDENIFQSDVSFRMHLSNVVDGIKRTHATPDDAEATHKSHMNLSLYVYLNCATRSHEKLMRGSNEYCFGKLLSCSTEGLLELDPTANDRIARVVVDEYPFNLPRDAMKLKAGQRRYLRSMLTDGLPQCGLSHELLDPNRPRGLLKRTHFYDAEGRLLFHKLFITLLIGLTDALTDLVEAKKVLMNAKHAMKMSSEPPSIENIHGLNEYLVRELKRTVLCFKMLNVLREEFDKVFNSHIVWICDIFAANPTNFLIRYQQNVNRPHGLYDEFAGFCKVPEDGKWNPFILSCCQWFDLLCQQETSMKHLRFPARTVSQRSRLWTTSIHISNCRPLYLRVSPPAYRSTMAPLGDWIKELGFTNEERENLLQYLVDQKILTQAEAEGRGFFKGCVHATAAMFCLSYLQRRRKWIEISKADYERLEVAALEDHLAPLLPDRSITDMIPVRRCLVVGTNKPFCAGCRVMLQRALFSHVYPEDFVYNRIVAEQWAEFDLPPWATRDLMNTLVIEGGDEAFKRIKQLLIQAAAHRGEASSTKE